MSHRSGGGGGGGGHYSHASHFQVMEAVVGITVIHHTVPAPIPQQYQDQLQKHIKHTR